MKKALIVLCVLLMTGTAIAEDKCEEQIQTLKKVAQREIDDLEVGIIIKDRLIRSLEAQVESLEGELYREKQKRK